MAGNRPASSSAASASLINIGEALAAAEASAGAADVPPVQPSAASAGKAAWRPHPRDQGKSQGNGCMNFCLAGDALELMMVPGDVLCVRGSGRLSEIGNAGGFLGHVLVVIAPPLCIRRDSKAAVELSAAWPSDEAIKELWQVPTMDCSRQSPGLHQTESLLYVERISGKMILAGEVSPESKLILNEYESVELWQSPRKLRESLRFDLMQEVVADMREHRDLDWSTMTVARAVMSSAWAVAKPTHEQTMESIEEYWTVAPICTSVVITFWQRYLVKLAGVVVSKKGPDLKVEPAELVMRWMPLKADRVLPGDLMATLSSCGWVSMVQIPRIFQPPVCYAPPPGMQLPPARRPLPMFPMKREDCDAGSPRGLQSSARGVRLEDSTILESRAVTLTC